MASKSSKANAKMSPEAPITLPEPKTSSAAVWLVFGLMVILAAALSVGYVYISNRPSTSGDYQTESAYPTPAVVAGSNDEAAISEDLDALVIDSFDADFLDLQKDLSNL